MAHKEPIGGGRGSRWHTVSGAIAPPQHLAEASACVSDQRLAGVQSSLWPTYTWALRRGSGAGQVSADLRETPRQTCWSCSSRPLTVS